MPHGRGHNKGFEYYMCKKFFHPNAPKNHELKWKAEQKQEAKEKLEAERSEEYKREQERWKTRHLLSSEEERLKMELSFMYEPPAGVSHRGPGPAPLKLKKSEDKGAAKVEKEGWSDSFCYKCEKQGHFARECKAPINFTWSKNAPRDPWAKDDPHVTDKPFGIQVIKIRCMKCEKWGHSHTDKICPKYGKARDSDEPILQVDPDVLRKRMRQEGLKLNCQRGSDIWANGKNKKQYDLVYSDDEEQDDLLLNLVSKMRRGKSKVSKNRKRRSHSSEDEEPVKKVVKKKKEKLKKRKAKKKKVPQSNRDVLSKVDEILEIEETGHSKKFSEEKVMRKVDEILFSDISTLATMSSKDREAARNKFLDEVDDVLGLGKVKDEEDTSDDDSEDSDSDVSDSEDEDLDEGEMRLLNLINANKIDVKVNFPSVYTDTDCHFCRQMETPEHLAECPVYDTIMTGSEFEDIRSEEMSLVKTALANIRAALMKRAEALSVTSLGEISSTNMKLLTMNERVEKKKTQSELIDEILATTT